MANCENQTTSKIEEQCRDMDVDSNTEELEIRTPKRYCNVNKPLIPLKVLLFFLSGSSSSLHPFAMLHIKHRGLTISQLSSIYFLLPIFRTIFGLLSGIFADKFKNTKALLLLNIVLLLLLQNSMLLIPKIRVETNDPNEVKLYFESHQNVVQNSSRLDRAWYFVVLEDGNIENCCDNFVKLDRMSCDVKNESFHRNFSQTRIVFDDVQAVKKFREANLTDRQFSCKIAIFFFNDSALLWEEYLNAQNFNPACMISCDTLCSELRNDTCIEPESNYWLVYTSTMVILVLVQIIKSAMRNIKIATTVSMANMHGSDYGTQRFWSVLGKLIFSALSAYLVDVTSQGGDRENFTAAFYLADTCLIFAMIVIYKMDIYTKPPADKMLKKSWSLIKNPDITMLAVAVISLGTCNSFDKTYSMLFLDSLGISRLIIGLNNTVKVIYGLPFLFTSKYWVKKIGCLNLVILAFLGFTVMFFGLSYLQVPSLSLLLQATGIFTYHLMWSSIYQHCYNIAPEGMTTTIISIAGIIFSSGKMVASAVGGLIMGKYGGRIALRLMGTISIVVGIFYAIYLFLRSRHRKRCTRKEPINLMEEVKYLDESKKCKEHEEEKEKDKKKLEPLISRTCTSIA